MKRYLAIPMSLFVFVACGGEQTAETAVGSTVPQVVPTTTIEVVASTVETTTTIAATTTTVDPDGLLKYMLGLTYKWGTGSGEQTQVLQAELGVTVDGVYGLETRGAHIAALEKFGMSTDAVPLAPQPTEAVVRPAGGKCEQWHQLALKVGFTEDQWPRLSHIINRESRCDPMAWNRADPTPDGSRGLTQINGFWCRPNARFPQGWLQQQGVLATCADLHNAEVSLRASYTIWRNSGWRPWGF